MKKKVLQVLLPQIGSTAKVKVLQDSRFISTFNL